MRKRVVTAGRQVLAKDVNDISDFLISDMNDLCKDVFAISTGIVNGFLNSGNSLLVATITAGKVHDNSTGTFFELIADTNVNLTASATNYIYAVQDSAVTTDLPVTGFKLIDTLTRAETYDTVNTRSYDSVSLVVNTTGIAPVDSHPLWELVTDATSVTSITDVRTFCTSGNLTAYSLQHFAQTGLNTVTIGSGISQRMTLELYKSSVADYIGLDIAMVSGFAGKGFNFNLSSNVGSIGGVITTNNNLGLNIVNTGNASKGIKIESSSILTTTTGLEIEKQKYGLSLINNDINIGAILSANQYGINISEVSSGTTGIVGVNITNVASSVNVTNANTRIGGNLINITATSSSLNGSNFLNTLNGTGVAQAIVMNGGASDISFGTIYKSTSTSGANVTAIAIGDSAVNITRGIFIEDCVTGIYINEVDASISINNTNSSRTGALIDITGAGSVSSPSLINLTQNGKGYAQTTILASGLLANVAYGNYITNTGVANSAVGIDIDGSTTGYNAFHTGVLMSGVTRGITIDETTDGITITNATNAIKLTNATKGIEITIESASVGYGSKITGNGNLITDADGYVATATRYGLDIGDSLIGFRSINNRTGISIDSSLVGVLIANDIGSTGIEISNQHKGILITNSVSSVHYGMKIIGSGITGSDAILINDVRYGLDINTTNTGIKITDSSLIGVSVDNAVLAYSSNNALVGLAVTGYTKAFINADILTTAPSGNAIGDMFLYYDSGAGTYNLVLYDGAVYRYLEFV